MLTTKHFSVSNVEQVLGEIKEFTRGKTEERFRYIHNSSLSPEEVLCEQGDDLVFQVSVPEIKGQGNNVRIMLSSSSGIKDGLIIRPGDELHFNNQVLVIERIGSYANGKLFKGRQYTRLEFR